MNIHDNDIELPPLPGDQGLQDPFIKRSLEAYGLAAIEADRKALDDTVLTCDSCGVICQNPWHTSDACYEADRKRRGNGYSNKHPILQGAWQGWQLARASLQSQDREDAKRVDHLLAFCVEPDENGFLQIRFETAMHVSNHPVETSAHWMRQEIDAAIDHARRAEGGENG